MKKQIVFRKKYNTILTIPVFLFLFLTLSVDVSATPSVYRDVNISMPNDQRYVDVTLSNRFVGAQIYQGQTAFNATETNADVSQKLSIRGHTSFYGAAYESDIAAGGVGIGVDAGASYETPIYSVELGIRRTALTLLVTAVEINSVTIGGRVFPNTFISPYIGGGLSINYIQGATIFEEGIDSATRPGIYGVLGVEIPHNTQFRFRIEYRQDWMVGVKGGTFGLSISRGF